ncbi:hypothetical protein K438DRAFT_488832 [Mycena galopus ATCC 62051]|nr:hypothetical protein K438DRAFT_488832 [Mycena galopus ATCC 62051]
MPEATAISILVGSAKAVFQFLLFTSRIITSNPLHILFSAINLFAQQPYKPSDGFFAVHTIWLSDGMTFEPLHLLSLLCMYSGHIWSAVATFTAGEPQFLLEISCSW